MPVTSRPNFDEYRQRIVREVRDAVRDSVQIARNEVVLGYSGPTGAPGTGRLGVRSGRLRSGVRFEIRGEPPAPIKGRVYIPFVSGKPNPVYARIHELGGTILPRRGQYLTFPIGRRGAAGRQGPWVRVRRVQMPARPVWKDAKERATPKIERRMRQAIQRIVR